MTASPRFDSPRFEIEAWRLPLREPEIGTLAAVESIFALANGHMGLRGTLDEGEPRARPGTAAEPVTQPAGCAPRRRR